MRAADREPKRKEDKSSKAIFLIIFAVILLAFAALLVLRPRGATAGPPSQTTSQH